MWKSIRKIFKRKKKMPSDKHPNMEEWGNFQESLQNIKIGKYPTISPQENRGTPCFIIPMYLTAIDIMIYFPMYREDEFSPYKTIRHYEKLFEKAYSTALKSETHIKNLNEETPEEIKETKVKEHKKIINEAFGLSLMIYIMQLQLSAGNGAFVPYEEILF